MRTTTFRLCGHVSIGPSAVLDQSNVRTRSPISPPPEVMVALKVFRAGCVVFFILKSRLLRSYDVARSVRGICRRLRRHTHFTHPWGGFSAGGSGIRDCRVQRAPELSL